jgi:hypothetical protein
MKEQFHLMKVDVLQPVSHIKTRSVIPQNVKEFLQRDEIIAHYEENEETEKDELFIRAVGLDNEEGTSIKGRYTVLPFSIPSGQYCFDRQEKDYLVFVKL